MAAPVKNPARIDYHARRVHFARDHALGLDLHTASGKNHAVKSSGDHHAIAFDLAFHLGALSEDHRLLRDDIALDVSVDAKRAFELQRALKCHTLIDESSPLFFAAIFRCAGPLPSHDNPQVGLPLYRPLRTSQRTARSELSKQTTEPMDTAVCERRVPLDTRPDHPTSSIDRKGP